MCCADPGAGMRRREFIAGLGGAAVVGARGAWAQQSKLARVGVLLSLAADDPEGQARLSVFLQGLKELGWTDGGNARIDIRWGGGDAELERRYAAELVALAPDVILASGGST